MHRIMDISKNPQELGEAVRRFRRARKLTQVQVSHLSGRSRDILYRLEQGKDVSVSALMDIVRAMGASLELRTAGLPTLEEMRERFAGDDDDAA
ncbi:XRE family transcriptional regulator [Ramlibacter sp. WS9]|nr:XRE family transcriptional regulator [Ramlibacter sp. WS9]